MVDANESHAIKQATCMLKCYHYSLVFVKSPLVFEQSFTLIAFVRLNFELKFRDSPKSARDINYKAPN
jgi:hypothetical protein